MRFRPTAVVLAFLLCSVSLRAAEALDSATGKEAKGVIFFDAKAIGIEGQAFADTKAPYDRLPGKADGVVRPPVWNLSRDSAGMAVRFVSDAPAIHARWSLTKEKLEMPHMAATGVSGLDLYVRTEKGNWHWLAVGKPAAQTTTAALISNIPAGKREYLLYLPLYNGVTSLEIGVPKGSTLFKPDARPAARAKPILFYGTSITHGACASRPGMVHTSILGRWFDRPVINLGFSGNGTMDDSMGNLLAELDVAVYVIDCLPNMDAKAVAAKAEPFIRALRKAKPNTPIVLVEDRTYGDAFLIESKAKRNAGSREEFRKTYAKLKAEGMTGLSYLEGEKLLGEDGDDTVDSSHPSDLGFMRQAEAMKVVLEPLLR
ncbi:SGNH/GDSL hydrolase family protein [Humisphaera borealis]|uniref:SGNH/GDSL hydrolase family protein n=1 Tax=Humisphaera borealis TaxID=2807512 RepID=A0A7M2X1K3_9BACT|nr:SGNH/GDSL hydrolase family protein [Humisphaera borealis]QOV91628.1 SGNH/GDSL hydrolase family protein [Humisphaera borealis]